MSINDKTNTSSPFEEPVFSEPVADSLELDILEEPSVFETEQKTEQPFDQPDTPPDARETQPRPRPEHSGLDQPAFMTAPDPTPSQALPDRLSFSVVTKKAKQDILLDRGQTKYLISGRTGREISSIKECSRPLLYLADFPMAPLGVIHVSSEYKYAHIMARKEFEDRGDLTPDSTLWIYDKRKVDTTQSKLVYQIFPQQRFATLTQHYSHYKPGFDLYDPLGMLLGTLTERNKTRIQVRALRLDASIILVAGNRHEIFQVQRYTLAGPDDLSLSDGINALEQDMISLEETMGVKIDHITWIEALVNDLNISIPKTSIPLKPAPVTMLNEGAAHGQTCWSALPLLMGSLSLKTSLIPREMRIARPLERVEPLLWAICATLIMALGIGAFTYSRAASELKAQCHLLSSQAAKLHAENAATEAKIQHLVREASMDIPHFMNVAQALSQASSSPGCGSFWNSMAAARSHGTRMDTFRLTYHKDRVELQLGGISDQAMIPAQEAFTNYLQQLKDMGFTITQQQLSCGLSSSRFSVHLEWPLVRNAS